MNIQQQIVEKIKAYDRIIIARHIRPDGDAVGSTLGLKAVLKNSFPEKEVYVINSDYSDYVGFLGREDEELADELYTDALAIVIDTATQDRISNKKYELAKEIIKIDHHVNVCPYGDLEWVEEDWSSACELVTYLCMNSDGVLKMNAEGASCLYAGMVTDSGRFRFNGTTGNTMRCAGYLLDYGIDTETLFARLYLEDFDFFKVEAYAYSKMKITPNGVAYLIVDKRMQKKFNLTREQASSLVSLMGEIKGCIVWLAFIENEDGTIRTRLRSRYVTINKLAEEYGGGGHICASGATLDNKKQINEMLDRADALCRDYKASNFYL